MPSLERLQEARDHGLLKSAQVQPLFDFLNQDPDSLDSSPDAEELHFLRGFHDIFIAIGIVILAIGFGVGSAFLFDGFWFEKIFTYGGLMALSWLLAEWITKRLRLALPSLLLAIGFSLSSLLTGDAILAFFLQLNDSVLLPKGVFGWQNSQFEFIGLLAVVFGIVKTLAFYKRFKVPITPALITAGFVGLALYLVGSINMTLLIDHMALWLLGIGLSALGVAMMFDIRDPKRRTLDSDKAFWLHLVAAPLLVHACLSNFASDADGGLSALVTIALVVVLGLVALIIDRRAMLASALGYLGYAISQLLNEINLDEAGIFALTLLLVGLFVLMLGSGWSHLRRIIMRPFAQQSWARYLPPVTV
ncbi:MAG: hypothetical protein OIF58_01150 [Cohaesibacter sp.]|nr:hypothetical protein [Cohaesibacter sp.]